MTSPPGWEPRRETQGTVVEAASDGRNGRMRSATRTGSEECAVERAGVEGAAIGARVTRSARRGCARRAEQEGARNLGFGVCLCNKMRRGGVAERGRSGVGQNGRQMQMLPLALRGRRGNSNLNTGGGAKWTRSRSAVAQRIGRASPRIGFVEQQAVLRPEILIPGGKSTPSIIR